MTIGFASAAIFMPIPVHLKFENSGVYKMNSQNIMMLFDSVESVQTKIFFWSLSGLL